MDSAAIAFNNVVLPKSALISKFADIDEATGKYTQKAKGLPVFHMIGHCLFLGRVAIAQAAIEFRRDLFEKTNIFTDQKEMLVAVWSDIPHTEALYEGQRGRPITPRGYAT